MLPSIRYRIIAAAMAAAALPVTAGAVTVISGDITANESYSFAEVLNTGEQLRFDITAQEDVTVTSFSLSATGYGTDLADVTFGFDGTPTNNSFDTIIPGGETISFAGDLIPGGSWQAGESFSVFVEDGIAGGLGDEVGITLSFATAMEDMAPIPVPGAGALLLTALAGGAAVARRKKRAA